MLLALYLGTLQGQQQAGARLHAMWATVASALPDPHTVENVTDWVVGVPAAALVAAAFYKLAPAIARRLDARTARIHARHAERAAEAIDGANGRLAGRILETLANSTAARTWVEDHIAKYVRDQVLPVIDRVDHKTDRLADALRELALSQKKHLDDSEIYKQQIVITAERQRKQEADLLELKTDLRTTLKEMATGLSRLSATR